MDAELEATGASRQACDAPELSVIIVSWNVRELLNACLASLMGAESACEAARLEVIVVDCASDDGSAAMVRRHFPQVTLLDQSENIGFTRGNNLGMARAAADTFLLLNPDTEVRGDALDQMLDLLRREPQVGIVGPHTLNSDGSHQSTRRRFPTLATGFFESTWLEKYAPAGIIERYVMGGTDDEAVLEVDWVQGSAFMLRRAVYDEIGGLDEGYVMYSEEMDYCRRAKAAGWQVYYHGGARIVHHGGKAAKKPPPLRSFIFTGASCATSESIMARRSISCCAQTWYCSFGGKWGWRPASCCWVTSRICGGSVCDFTGKSCARASRRKYEDRHH